MTNNTGCILIFKRGNRKDFLSANVQYFVLYVDLKVNCFR